MAFPSPQNPHSLRPHPSSQTHDGTANALRHWEGTGCQDDAGRDGPLSNPQKPPASRGTWVDQGRAMPGRPISLQLGSCGSRSPESGQASFLHLYLGLLLTLLKGSQGSCGEVPPNQGFYEAGSRGDRQEQPCLVEEKLTQESAEAAETPGPGEL